jgi:hypothetical protein
MSLLAWLMPHPAREPRSYSNANHCHYRQWNENGLQEEGRFHAARAIRICTSR